MGIQSHAPRRGLLLLAVVAGLVAITTAQSCEVTVRDLAFRSPRDTHLLCVIANAADSSADATMLRLANWLETAGAELNVELVRVEADEPDVDWSKYSLPSAPAPEMLPAVVLVGRTRSTRGNFFVAHWAPAPTDEELNCLVESPVRSELQQRLGRQLAVLLYARSGSTSSEDVANEVERTAHEWSRKKGLPAVSVLEIDRFDESERVTAAFMGIGAPGKDWLGVVFGRGKLMGPPLVDSEITAEAIGTQLTELTQDCTCSKPLSALGVDLPMSWSDRFDAELEPEELAAETEDVILGEQPAKVEGAEPSTRTSMIATTLWAFGVLIAAVGVTACVTLWRRYR